MFTSSHVDIHVMRTTCNFCNFFVTALNTNSPAKDNADNSTQNSTQNTSAKRAVSPTAEMLKGIDFNADNYHMRSVIKCKNVTIIWRFGEEFECFKWSYQYCSQFKRKHWLSSGYVCCLLVVTVVAEHFVFIETYDFKNIWTFLQHKPVVVRRKSHK